MKIVLPGGTGQIGALLARAFARDGHEVVVLSRRPRPGPWRAVAWDADPRGAWAAELEGAGLVVNLAGRSVDCRYTAENRRQILESRVATTRALGEAMARARNPPPVWLQSSTATLYAHRFDAPNDEDTGIVGGDEPDAPEHWRFSTRVARDWEAAAVESAPAGTRLVLLRSAMVMSPDRGGVFDTLLRLVRLGLGGTAGSGRQYVSWIHEADFVGAVQWLAGRDDVHGPVNLASPGPLPNRDFMRLLRRAWGARLGLPATEWMLEIGALALRTETELVLKSRRVVPGRLQAGGFGFRHPDWGGAAEELCRRWRAARGGAVPPPGA